MAEAAEIRDRIVDFRRVPAEELRANPKNWRVHPAEQQTALRAVLSEVGVAGAVVAYDDPKHGLTVIDGHLRTEALAGEQVPVLIVDVNADEADKLLATMNPLAEMAETDAAALVALMADLEMEDENLKQMMTDLGKGIGLYQPSLDPSESGVTVTDADIAKASAAQDDQFGIEIDTTLEITCPHCGGDFHIDKPK